MVVVGTGWNSPVRANDASWNTCPLSEGKACTLEVGDTAGKGKLFIYITLLWILEKQDFFMIFTLHNRICIGKQHTEFSLSIISLLNQICEISRFWGFYKKPINLSEFQNIDGTMLIWFLYSQLS